MVNGMSTNSLPLTSVYSSSFVQGRITLPVRQSQLLYANFEHVTGVSAGDSGGYTIDKLQILNTLIERLASYKKNPEPGLQEVKAMSPERIDALITQYEKEIHTAVAQAVKPYVPKPAVEPGMLVAMSA